MAEKPAKKRRVQLAHWCFTSYQDVEKVRENIRDALVDGRVVYCVWNVEAAPTTGRVHLQGYIELARSQDGRFVQKVLGDDGAHYEARRGTRDQARNYCLKEATRIPGTEPEEYGRWRETHQGERTDLAPVVDKIKSGANYQTIAIECTAEFIKYHRGIREAIGAHSEQLSAGVSRTIETFVFWGGTGLGKTRRAKFENPDAYYLDVHGGKLWWDGYSMNDTVIIDEFKGELPLHQLQKIIDPHGCMDKLEVKGGFVPANFTKVVITSNWHPRDWYRPEVHKGIGYDKSPLARRLPEKNVIQFTEEWLPPAE